jgi:UDP-N-acetylglucosamine diphosphorylase/glucosamine-1-phosphate N-acetyltransferase
LPRLQVAIFEDDALETFSPLTHTRPVFDLRCGARSFRARIMDLFRAPDALLFVRDYLTDYVESKEKRHVNRPEEIAGAVLFINGLLIPDRDLALRLSRVVEGNIGVKDGRLVFICLGQAKARELAERLSRPLTGLDVSQMERSASKRIDVQEAQLLGYPWELVKFNIDVLSRDFPSLKKSRAGDVHPRATILGKKGDLSLGSGSSIEAGAVVDARTGPVYIGSNSTIFPGSWVQGPAYIGSGTSILPFASIHGGSSIGDGCRIGAEVEATVIHGYVNNAHAGFIGHSYLGEWVNVGALTASSDLKNTYGTIKVSVRGQRVDTGETMIGAFIADYVRTSVGVTIYPGKKLGVGAQVHGTVSEDVPSFSIYAKTLGAKMTEIFYESVAETQRRMYGKRKVEQTAADITLLKKVYDLTRDERKASGVLQGRSPL